MPRVVCHYENCKFLDDRYCVSTAVEIDPFDGCMTYFESRETVSEGVLDDVDNGYDSGWEDAGYDEVEEDQTWETDDADK